MQTTLFDQKKCEIALGAQNCHWEEKGRSRWCSPAFLTKLDVAYVIVGHSGGASSWLRSNEIVNTKVKAVFKHSMTPIMCVGETRSRSARPARPKTKVDNQVRDGLAGVTDQVASMVIAYGRSGRSAPARRRRPRTPRRCAP
ncbi:MAG: triose-phosphate isomerase [Acidimicrobiales bacterium]